MNSKLLRIISRKAEISKPKISFGLKLCLYFDESLNFLPHCLMLSKLVQYFNFWTFYLKLESMIQIIQTF